MRVSILVIALATAITVSAQDIISEYAVRKVVWITNPTPCSSSSGCVRPVCGKAHQCGDDATCGTWGGKKDHCCKIVGQSGDTGCEGYEDQFKNINLATIGDQPAKRTGTDVCGNDALFIVSDVNPGGSGNYCCPFGKDAILDLKYTEFIQIDRLNSVRCIDPIGGSPTEPDDSSMSGTPSGTDSSPTTSQTGSATSQTPNAAVRAGSAFALAPAAFMILAAL